MPTPLIALDEVKAYLHLRPGEDKFDSRLTQLSMVASRQIETYCRRDFALTEYTELHPSRRSYTSGLALYTPDRDGLGSGLRTSVRDQTISLRAAPIDTNATISVYYDPQRKFEEITLINPDHYFVDAEKGRIILRYPTDNYLDSIKTVYTAGYAEADGTLSASAPADLKQAAIIQTLHMFNRMDLENIGAEDNNFGGDSVSMNASAIVKDALALLVPYRRVLTGRA